MTTPIVAPLIPSIQHIFSMVGMAMMGLIIGFITSLAVNGASGESECEDGDDDQTDLRKGISVEDDYELPNMDITDPSSPFWQDYFNDD